MTPCGGEPWNFQSPLARFVYYGVNTTQAALGFVASRGGPTSYEVRICGVCGATIRAGETVFTKVRRPPRGM